MNTLRENNNTRNTLTQSPSSDIDNTSSSTMASNSSTTMNKPKTPLKKEELEKIAKELKKKLSKASITAKQSLSPTAVRVGSSIPKSSPLKHYMVKKQFGTPNNSKTVLSSSPNALYSPYGKSPTQIKAPAAIYLNSSPLKNMASDSNNDEDTEMADSPTNKQSPVSGKDAKKQPQMVLEQVQPPNTSPKPLSAALIPSPALTTPQQPQSSQSQPPSQPRQTTPTLQKRQIYTNPNSASLLKTPTQSRPSTNGSYNDEEGADLLMYLATSPSPAKPYFSNTPRLNHNAIHQNSSSSIPNSSGSLSITNRPGSSSSQSSFIAPPPLTPKRHITTAAGTPQNRITPSINLFNNLSSNNGNGGLPSSGLTLTPAGFNMNDYVNFFTPSPGGANAHSNNGLSSTNKNFLRTPDFNNLLNGSNQKQRVDGKMINFDKVLFGNGNSSNENTAKE